MTLDSSGDVVAYKIQGDEPGSALVVVNGKKGKGYPSVTRPLLSRDGKTCAYLAYTDEFMEEGFAVINGVEGPLYSPLFSSLAISGDGDVVAYVAERDDESYFLITGNQERVLARPEPVAHPLKVFLNHDGSKVGLLWGVVGSKPHRYWVEVGSQRGKTYASISQAAAVFFRNPMSPIFGGPGDTVVYKARREGKDFVVVGDREFSAPGIGSAPVMSSDGSRVGYGARLGNALWYKVIHLE